MKLPFMPPSFIEAVEADRATADLLTPPKTELRSSDYIHTHINTIRYLKTGRSSNHTQSRATI